MKKFLVIFVILFGTLPAFSTQWVEVTKDVQVDIDSIDAFINDYGRIEPNRFIFWVKKNNTHNHTFTHLEHYYKKEIGYFIDKAVIDFQLKKIAIKANNIYDIDFNLMNRFDIPDYRQDWHYIAPDSPEQAIYDEVLKYKIKYDTEQKRLSDEKIKQIETQKQAEVIKAEQNRRLR